MSTEWTNLYKFVIRLSLAEFMQYTNITTLIQTVLSERNICAAGHQWTLIFDYVKNIYTNDIRNEQNWSKGYFRNVRLTENFYSSSTAESIFASIYGTKKCDVSLDRVDFGESNRLAAETESDQSFDNDDSITSSMDNDRWSPCESFASMDPDNQESAVNNNVQRTRKLFHISLEQAKESFEKYVRETTPSELSVTSFWKQFSQSEMEGVSL